MGKGDSPPPPEGLPLFNNERTLFTCGRKADRSWSDCGFAVVGGEGL